MECVDGVCLVERGEDWASSIDWGVGVRVDWNDCSSAIVGYERSVVGVCSGC